MQITRLYLRNYRVYEEPLDLAIPPGLVGVYGVNGAGKSVLLEAILFTLWGKARTDKAEIRTAGIVADCVTEVEFEHEGHLYLVRRALSGAGATVRAEAHADGAQVSEGVRDTGRYVHSVLGMDDGAFRASVFAEQKQLAAFSVRRPGERRDLVLALLGITPLDAARDQARRDSRDAHTQLDQVRAVLADLGGIEAELEEHRAEDLRAAARAAEAAERAGALAVAAAAAEDEHRRVDELGRAFDSLVADGRARRAERDSLAERKEGLEAEARGFAEAETALVSLEERASGLTVAQARLGLVDALLDASVAFERAQGEVPAPPPPLDSGAAAEAQARAQAERERLAGLEGRRAAAADSRERAAQAVAKALDLSGEADCPLCGQPLEGAFEAVQAHRRAELEAAEAALAELTAEAGRAAEAARSAAEAARNAQVEESLAQAAAAAWERATGRCAEARARLEAALDAATAGGVDIPVPGPGSPAPGPGSPAPGAAAGLGAARDGLAAEVAAAQRCAREAAILRGRLHRRPVVEAELHSVGARIALLDAGLAELREALRALEYRPQDLAAAALARDEAVTAAQAAARAAQAADLAEVAARARVDSCARRLEDARDQHRRLGELGEKARHLGRTAELLGAFRNEVVGSVGPRLSAQANELFGELTDHEYDGLEVDPETYDIRISDKGSTYGMDRFSGSETDLANLALRVAISEHVRFQSGGAVGLLVLDEVFGPLDADRKERMLLALQRLKGRFRQVLVVTHDNDLKEQLPNAIEVVKLPGRRATARVL